MRKEYTLWTKEAEQIVKDNFDKITNQAIADKIHKRFGLEYSSASISSKAKRMGLEREEKENVWLEELNKFLPTIYPTYSIRECIDIIEKKVGIRYTNNIISTRIKWLGLKKNPVGVHLNIKLKASKPHEESKIISDVTFADSKPRDCRYMDVGRSDAPICGKPIVKGSYCFDCYVLTHEVIKGRTETDRKMRTHIRALQDGKYV